MDDTHDPCNIESRVRWSQGIIFIILRTTNHNDKKFDTRYTKNTILQNNEY